MGHILFPLRSALPSGRALKTAESARWQPNWFRIKSGTERTQGPSHLRLKFAANASAGKLRRKGTIRQKVMFRKLRNGRNLRAGSTDQEAWIGFSGRAAEIARVHHEGLRDKPSRKSRAVRYAERGLLGLTQADQSRALDMMLNHVASK